VDFPENAAEWIGTLLGIANFEFPLVNVGDVLGWAVELPEEGSESIIDEEEASDERWVEAITDFEFETRFCGNALGSPYLIFLVTDCVYVLIFFLYCCQNRCTHDSAYAKLRTWLYNSSFMWNYLLRFFIQMSLDIFILFLLNLRLPIKPWERFSYSTNWLETLDYFHLMFFAAGTIWMTVFIPIFYLRYFSLLKDYAFTARFGTVYEDMDLDKKSILI
jgi:hypothetical protein